MSTYEVSAVTSDPNRRALVARFGDNIGRINKMIARAEYECTPHRVAGRAAGLPRPRGREVTYSCPRASGAVPFRGRRFCGMKRSILMALLIAPLVTACGGRVEGEPEPEPEPTAWQYCWCDESAHLAGFVWCYDDRPCADSCDCSASIEWAGYVGAGGAQ